MFDRCELCGAANEDIEDVLRSCIAAKGIWGPLIPNKNREEFFSIPVYDWLTRNLFDNSFFTNDESWQIRFIITCWLIWKRRCSLLLAPTMGVLEDITSRCNQMVEECQKAFISGGENIRRQNQASIWTGPPSGWIKLNVDASVSMADNKAGIGGVLRDEQGNWIFGFARSIGRCSVILAELWAIHDGLLHTWNLNHRNVILESDYLEAVQIINYKSKILANSALITSIKKMINKEWRVEVNHIGRDKNRITDRLALRGRDGELSTVSFTQAPRDIASLIEDEGNMHDSQLVTANRRMMERPFDPGGEIN
ncbi:hypothetical protein V6N11_019092 [Hibiscus sabdariffa]|uniref:RNase H type-1 domain-containing protein n=1 Tax=Hibiscus sabdariffa TaxID=183260 RepID=A0ABR2R1L7_9ROSI